MLNFRTHLLDLFVNWFYCIYWFVFWRRPGAVKAKLTPRILGNRHKVVHWILFCIIFFYDNKICTAFWRFWVSLKIFYLKYVKIPIACPTSNFFKRRFSLCCYLLGHKCKGKLININSAQSSKASVNHTVRLRDAG